ncbi:hypothetical protein AC1031_012994 [Aphanomyces cochlioides]|nr:hypothetical protein AC1031_012994 [Aphanomyces cochlioides]
MSSSTALRLLPILSTTAAALVFTICTRHVRTTRLSSLRPANLIARFLDVPNQYVDVYETTLSRPTTVQELARAFFESPVFQVERRVLKLAGAGEVTDEAIQALNFEPGDAVATFQVVENAPGEILLCWSDKETVNGHSWLALTENGTTVLFGSTIRNDSLFVRLITPLHCMYAKIVLASARYELEKSLKE